MNWQAAVEATVTGLGYELVDAERTARGLLRVFIDHPASATPSDATDATDTADTQPDTPSAERISINVEDCERVTRQLQRVLEVENIPYERLEVSSPGLDRPLKKASDYARFVGEQVEVTLKKPFNGQRKYLGVLASLTSEAQPPVDSNGTPYEWRLVWSEGKTEQALDFSLDEVRGAHLVPVLDFKGRRFADPSRVASDDDALMPQPPAQDTENKTR